MFLAVTFPAYLESAIAWRAGVMVPGDVFSPPAYQGVVHDILQFMASNNFLTDHNVGQRITINDMSDFIQPEWLGHIAVCS